MNKFTMMLTAPLIAFAAPDAVQGGNIKSEGAVLEHVSFRLLDGTDPSDFLNAAHATEALLRERGALIRRYLVREDDGVWRDIIEWTSMDEALAAAEAVMQAPDFAPFAAMIDPKSVEMRHTPILWQME